MKNSAGLIGVMKKLSLTRPRNTLLTVFKSLVRSDVTYVDIIYGKPFNEAFKCKLEMVHAVLLL